MCVFARAETLLPHQVQRRTLFRACCLWQGCCTLTRQRRAPVPRSPGGPAILPLITVRRYTSSIQSDPDLLKVCACKTEWQKKGKKLHEYAIQAVLMQMYLESSCYICRRPFMAVEDKFTSSLNNTDVYLN